MLCASELVWRIAEFGSCGGCLYSLVVRGSIVELMMALFWGELELCTLEAFKLFFGSLLGLASFLLALVQCSGGA